MNVKVIYNGVSRNFYPEPDWLVSRLLGEAVVAFSPVYKTELLAFFGHDGRELVRSETLADSGVSDGEEFLLRTTVVR